MLQDLRECLGVPTHKTHLIISASFLWTLGEVPFNRKPCELQRLWGFCLLPLNRHICRKVEKGQPAQVHCPVKLGLIPSSSGCRWEEESRLDMGAGSPASFCTGQ